VVTNDGRERKGILATLSSTSIGVLVEGKREELGQSDVRRITRANPDSLANGALIGAAVGGGVVGGVVLIACATGCHDLLPGMFAATAFYVGIGTGVGLLVDALRKDHTVVYERNSPSRVLLEIAPMLGSQRKGVRFAIVW
jgi:hypothetical protein